MRPLFALLATIIALIAGTSMPPTAHDSLGDLRSDAVKLLAAAPVSAAVDDDTPLTSATEKEANLRTSIKRHVARYEKQNDLSHGSVNKELIRHFDKPRGDMTLTELSRVWSYLQREYPLDD